ncbi:MAG TPA: CotH kinase family protein, partial [Polyangia bacterium]
MSSQSIMVCRKTMPSPGRLPRKDMTMQEYSLTGFARTEGRAGARIFLDALGGRVRSTILVGLLDLQMVACAASPSKPVVDASTEGGSSVTNPCLAGAVSLTDGNAAELFGATKVPTFDVYLPAADWEALKVHARDELFVPVQACFEGMAIGQVGLRFKGSYGSLYNCFNAAGAMTCPRLSMKMKFDEYTTDLRFFGLKRLAFNAYMYDDSRIKEKLAYDLYRAMGIVAPRSAWAVLRVNG